MKHNEDEVQTNNLPEEAVHQEIVWRKAVPFALFHVFALYGWYLMLSCQCKLATVISTFLIGYLGGIGITAGAHRLWAHRSYKAKLPLRIFLAILHTFNFQYDIYSWVRDHRVHHKYSETDADPHNSKRGFFFSHMGWVFVKKHPKVVEKGQELDLSDILADPVVRFQRKYYFLLMLPVAFILPVSFPILAFGETLHNSLMVMGFARFITALHATFLVNSAAHMWGSRPYDRNLRPAENRLVAFLAVGEGWHNYHHVFPWDYKTAEWGGYALNVSRMFIDFMAFLGQAYDLRSVSQEVIQKRIERTGSPGAEKLVFEKEY